MNKRILCPNCRSVLSRYEATHKKCSTCDDDLSDDIVDFLLGVGVGMVIRSLFDNDDSSSSSSDLSSNSDSSFEGFGGGSFGGGGADSDW